MRTSAQNALFRRVRFSSPGQTSSHLTEKRTLQPAPHGKAHSAQASHQKVHSGLIDSRKAAFCDSQIAQTAPFRHIAAPGKCGATPRQAAGHYGECLNWANALEQPPARLRGGCAGNSGSARPVEKPSCLQRDPPAKGRLRVRVRSRSHPGRSVLTSAQRLRVRSPSRPALSLGLECFVSYVHRQVAVYGALSRTLTAE